CYLIENYRSTQNIISAANCLIEQNPARLKQEHPIQINQGRRKEPAGGIWQSMDSDGQGQVLRLVIPEADRGEGNLQAQAAMARLEALQAQGNFDWCDCAILSRSHKYLLPV